MNAITKSNAVIADVEIIGQSRQAISGIVSPPTVLDSVRLFNGQRELIIQHQGEQYRLRITRQEKLILTK
ncbi:MAG: hemin uptake protein HemP [Burkholderiaceae bacterium]|nr:hemin uptake protein HemP [Burkholderiaceae bacterium]